MHFSSISFPRPISSSVPSIKVIAIEKVELHSEKTSVYHPEYNGIRLDVFARDENHTHYNVEMRVARQRPGRRSRYYHSQIDMEILLSGQPYEEMLKDGRLQGRAEGRADGKTEGMGASVLKFLEELGSVPESLRQCIMNEKDESRLAAFLKMAAKAESVEQFIEKMHLK